MAMAATLYLTTCLIVRVCNFSGADRDLLAQSAEVAHRIFQRAGIEMEWAIAASPGVLDPSILTVQIFPGRSRRSEVQEAFGVALLGGGGKPPFLADIFLGNIEEVSYSRKDAALLLGHVMAHEVGHLLLGADHTPGTIMSGSLGARNLAAMVGGQLRFNQSQAGRLRAAAALRNQACKP
jgi:hypothetical protein